MSEFRLEPPTSVPPPPPPPVPEHSPPDKGSLAAGVGLAWLVMVIGELLVFMAGSSFNSIMVGVLLPPVAIVIWAVVLLGQGKTRTGKGMFLGLLSIVAVLLLLVAACFGLLSNMHLGGMH